MKAVTKISRVHDYNQYSSQAYCDYHALSGLSLESSDSRIRRQPPFGILDHVIGSAITGLGALLHLPDAALDPKMLYL